MSVLFIGLGAMGTPMATRLAEAGHELVLCDLREEHARDLAERLGATHVPLDRAGPAGTVILMLPDSRAVEGVLDRLFPRLTAGTLVVDMSSSAPAATVALAARAAERGLDYLDAPVSGGVARAESGELSIMVGGAEPTVARARPLLAALGTGITHVGPSGAGHAMKALNNLLSAVGLVAAAEVLAIGANFGLEPQTMLDVLNASTGGNHATRVKMARFVLSRAFDSGFSLQLMVKDLRTALDLAADTATPVPVSALAMQEWTAAGRALDPTADHTHIAAYVEGRAGVELHRPAEDPPADPRIEEPQ
jgi:3-hydroxyisobutyrate dehydrogenase